MFFSFDYIGSGELAGQMFAHTGVTVQAKGLSEMIESRPTANGPLLTMPVSLMITIDGIGAYDIHADTVMLSFPDVGIVGFGVAPATPVFRAIAFEYTGYDLATSIGPTAFLGATGKPVLLPTVVGLLVLRTVDSGTFTAVASNPAPGSGAALVAFAGWAAARRRRAATSG